MPAGFSLQKILIWQNKKVAVMSVILTSKNVRYSNHLNIMTLSTLFSCLTLIIQSLLTEA